ncbi:MAG: DUF4347 domain-containing protein [Magnetococcus sp. MYC-9]
MIKPVPFNPACYPTTVTHTDGSTTLPVPTTWDASPAVREIVFVDPTVPDLPTLLGGIRQDATVVLLDAGQDGVAQVGAVLANQRDLSAIHILSHGGPGSLELGTAHLSSDTLAHYANNLQAWAGSMTAEADILLYGCDVAVGRQGERFIQYLSQQTGADVAASTNKTGDAALGGDWWLEKQTGSIEAGPLLSQRRVAAFHHLLGASVINLSTLNGSTGFRLDGVAAWDESGGAAGSAGDFNGDGFDDLIVGAAYSDPNGLVDAGTAYVVFGKAEPFNSRINLSTLNGRTGFRLWSGTGRSNERFGYSAKSAGDINGDGFSDLIVGARLAWVNGVQDAGSSYVVFGRAAGFTAELNLSSLDGSTGFRLDGLLLNENAGYSVSSAGDVNGDGFDDLVIGSFGAEYAGSTYVVFGKTTRFDPVLSLASLNGSTGFRLDGVAAGDQGERDASGIIVDSAGDVNGDGYADLIIGSYKADADGKVDTGASYVVFGKAAGFTPVINLATLNGSNGFRVNGPSTNSWAGVRCSSAGDINGDGFDDIAIGAVDSNKTGFSGVVFGKASGFSASINLSTLNGSNGFRLKGTAATDYAAVVSAAGDVNGDGFDDLMIGAPGSGSAYVLFGHTSAFNSVIQLSSLNGSSGFRLFATPASDQTGETPNRAGDINGDGFDDLVIGADYASPDGRTRAGFSHVLFGSNSTNAVTFLGSNGADTLNAGTPTAERFVAGGGHDTLVGGGGADVFYGGEGNDSITVADVSFQRVDGGRGEDTLVLSGAGMSLNLTTLRGKIESIESMDITGEGNNILTLTALDLLNLSDSSNTLTVRLNHGDTVNKGSGWTQGEAQTVGGLSYDTYTQGQAVLRIEKLGPAPILSIQAAKTDRSEGDAGSTPFTFTVTRTGSTTTHSTVRWAVTGSGNSGASARDFAGNTLPSGTVAFAAGESSKEVTVLVAGETEGESDEGFTVTLSAATGAIIDIGTATATVRNDDPVLGVTHLDLDAADDTGSSSSDDITRNTNRLTISGSAGKLDSTLSLFDDSNGNGLQDGQETLGTVPVTTLTGEWSTDIALSAGTHTLRAIQTTLSGKASAASDPLVITIDTTAPSVRITSPSAPTTNEVAIIQGLSSDANMDRVDLQILDQDSNTYRYLNKFGFLTPGNSGNLIPTERDKSLGNWSTDVGGGWLPHTYAVTAVAQDVAGNRSTHTITFGFTADGNQLRTRIDLDKTLLAIRADQTVTINGQLKRADGADWDMSGQTIHLQITDPNGGSPRSFEAKTYDRSGHFTSGPLSGFTDPGGYAVHVSSESKQLLAAASSYADVRVGNPVGYAILVQGELDTGKSTPEGLLAHKRTTNRIYETLLDRGFTQENIKYFNFDTSTTVAPIPDPPDGAKPDYRNLDGVKAMAPSEEELKKAIVTWAREQMLAAPAPLYIILADHGSPEMFHIGLNNGAGQVSSAELGGWLNELNSGFGTDAAGKQALDQKQVVILGACNSGSFIDDLATPANNRIVITSSTAQEKSYRGATESDKVQNGEMFLQYLFQALGKGYTLYDAFQDATRLTETNLVVAKNRENASTNSASDLVDQRITDESGQHPLLNDNGDRWGSNELSLQSGMDGATATFALGTTLSSQQNSAENPVQIGKVAPAVYDADASPTVLWVQETNPVADSPHARSGWVSVMGPRFVQTTGKAGEDPQLSFDLPTGSMKYNTERKRWEILANDIPEFGGFTDAGRYEFQYTLQDAETGQPATPMVGYVYKNKQGNSAPSQVTLQSPSDTGAVNNTALFNWSDATDPDKNPVTYTLTIARDRGLTDELYREENLSLSRALVDFTAIGLTDGDYWWRVEAVDSFGAHTPSALQSFTLSLTNAPIDIVRGIVYSSQDFARLAAASLSLNGKPIGTTEKDGTLETILSSTNGILKVEAPGYQTKSIAVTSADARQKMAQIKLDPVTIEPFTTQMGSLSSTQVAALSVTQVGGLRDTQIGAMSSNQIKALSRSLMAGLPATQVAGFTATQIKTLSSSQISALSATQLAGLASGALASLSAEQIKGLGSTQVAGLPAKYMTVLSATLIKALTTTQMAGLDTTQIQGLSSTQIGILTTTQMRGMGKTLTEAMSTTQIRGLGSTQIGSLTLTQMGALAADRMEALTVTQVKGLTSSQLGGLTVTQMGGMSTTGVAALSTTQMRGWGAEQIRAMGTRQVAALSSALLGSLTTTQLGGLESADLAILNKTQMQALGSQQLRGLSSTQLGGLTPLQIASLSTGQLGALRSDQIRNLSGTQLGGLSATHIGILGTSQLTALQSVQIAALGATQVGALSRAQIAYLGTTLVAGLAPSLVHRLAVQGLTTLQMDALSATQIGGLSSTQITQLVTSQLVAFGAEDVAALTPAQVKGLSVSQLVALDGKGQLAGLEATDLAALSSSQLGALSATRIGRLTTTQLSGLSSSQVKDLSTTQARALSATQVAALTTTQVRGLEAVDIGMLTASIGGLGSAQVAVLSVTQMGGLTATLLRALSADQVGGLSVTHVKALTAAQMAGLTAGAVAALGMADSAMSRIKALSAAQIAGLTTTAVAGLAEYVAYLSPAQIKGFETGDFAALGVATHPFNASQIGALSAAHMKAYTAAAGGTLPTS